MRRFVLIMTAILPGARVWAQDWQVLDGPAIVQALSARVLAYPDGAMQNFFTDGRTLYEVSGGESWGKWWAEGGKYCSTWPPSETPACYHVAARGLEIRFTSTGGDETIGHYIDLN